LTIHDIRGRQVGLLADGHYAAGTHTVTWDGTDSARQELQPGVYFIRLRTRNHTETRKSIYIR